MILIYLSNMSLFYIYHLQFFIYLNKNSFAWCHYYNFIGLGYEKQTQQLEQLTCKNIEYPTEFYFKLEKKSHRLHAFPIFIEYNSLIVVNSYFRSSSTVFTESSGNDIFKFGHRWIIPFAIWFFSKAM